MQQLTAGITKAGTGIDGIVWNILGQTYVPKHVCDSSFSWHATFPPGTFVPPHIHPTQDEFIYMFTVKCFFWVSPTRKLYDLFWAIHSMKEQSPPEVVALSAKHEVVFLPPPGP